MTSRKWFRGAALVVVGLISLVIAGVGAPISATATASHVRIAGSGSSWSAVAVLQWVSDVSSSGLQVDFNPSGSTLGRKDFANGITDFGVTDIGYQGTNRQTGEDDRPCNSSNVCRAYAYEPIVAGGTSFPYQIKVSGQLVRNLRLSGQTLAKIFTYKITNWNDPEITADNNGRQLPSLPIIPVVHQEGSGSTAQFTTYLNNQYPAIWKPFNNNIQSFTEFYPPPTGSQRGIAQNGSDGLMNFVSSADANGAIGYDEYSYPLAKNWPVAKLENEAGYFTLPSQYNVAVALTHAIINLDKNSPNYLLQDLSHVYVAPEKQAYAMSSYSYFLIPTGSNDPRVSTAKRQTLADYLYYAVCQGQREIGPIGYSPLPINLVEASFAQTAKLKTADSGVDLNQRNVTTCQNPTFVAGHPEINHLAQIAPIPPNCDKVGQGPANGDGSCAGAGGSGGGGGNGGGGGGNNGGANGTGKPGSGGKIASNGALPGSGISSFGDNGNNGGVNAGNAVAAANVLPQSPTHGLTNVLAPLAVIELLAVLIGPPLVYFYVLRRRRKSI